MVESSPDERSMSPETLARNVRERRPISVLDVRNRDEFESWHVTGASVTATQIPYARFVQAQVRGGADELVDGLSEPIVVVCGRGEASAEVATQLSESGVDAVNLDGGMEAWARLFVSAAVPCDEATVLQYQRPSSGCLSYLVVSGDEALVVDPLRAFAGRYVDDAETRGADLVYAVDTHVHADHVSGVRTLSELTGARVVLPEGARARGLAFDAVTLTDGDELSVGDVTLEAMALPGHTTEMLGFSLADLLFGGDTVFVERVARPDLESGDEGAPAAARSLYRTLHAIVDEFDDETRILPTHFSDADRPTDDIYVTTVHRLHEQLATLGTDESTFVRTLCSSMPPQPNNYAVIVETNLGRHSVDDEEAFEIELGPNNCAATV